MTKHLHKNAKGHKRAGSFSFPFTGVEVGKYISILLLILFIVWIAVFRSGSTKPFEEVAQAVQLSIQDEDLVLQDSQALKKYYGLNSAEYEGVLFYTSDFTMSAKEVLLIKLKDETQVEEVKAAIDERLETRKSSFEGYAPEQVQLLDQAVYSVRENYIFLAVTPDAEEYSLVFSRSL